MSRDIRSFFTVLSSKTTPSKTPSQKRSHKDIEDDVIPDTPDSQKPSKNEKSKRRRIVQSVSSDSETENDKPKTKITPKKPVSKTASKPKTKPKVEPPKKKVESPKKKVNPFEAFGDAPVKQDKVEKKPELNIHDDDDFEKTLIDLDEEELFQQAEASSSSKKTSEPEIKKTTPVKQPEKKERKEISSNDTPKKEKNEAEAKKTPAKQNEAKKEKTPGRKRSNDDEEHVDNDQERYEKKRYSAMLYQKYLNRSGPVHPGAKWTPKGKPDCLKGLCFIITGVLESMQREEAQNLIVEHGGRCTQSVSGKVNYMVLGDDAGPSKVEKARKLGTKMISEDDLIDLICIKSGIQNQNKKEPSSDNKFSQASQSSSSSDIVKTPPKVKKETPEKKEKPEPPAKKMKKEVISDDEDEIPSTTVKSQEIVKPVKQEKEIKKEVTKPVVKKEKKVESEDNLAWVDKYKPKDISQIIGQQGPNSNMNKLIRWLQNWQKNRQLEAAGKGPSRPSPWAKDDNGAYFRCALLSGSPGVGKSTTAALVCQHLGLDVVEFNASDTRSKRVVQHEVQQLISTTSIAHFANHGGQTTSRHVLVMDEVDGMSGNEDRGGIQEMILMIKKTQVPIICMCNDRQHPKIRSLANYCFDLRFSKPKVEQIRGAMMSICYKEHLPLKPDALAHVIMGTGQDVRQTLNQLSLMAAGQSAQTPQSIDAENVAKEAQKAQKDTKLGPWEVIRKVFSEEDAKTMSFIDHSKLFFYDYSIGPLFVQENYLKVVPHAPKSKHLELFAQAADAISMGDVIDSKIRSTQGWALLEIQAVCSSVAPGQLLRGHMGGQIDFPQWLGKNSKYNKMMRLAGEIHAHTRISTTADKTSLLLDQAKVLRDVLAHPLLKYGTEGIPAALEIMKSYNLLREDVTSLVELAKWPNTKDPFESVDSKVKAAFTRAYNKEMPALPYATPSLQKKKATNEEEMYGEDEEANESEEENDDDVAKDGMIKMKKPSKTDTSKAATSKASKGKASTSGRGRAKKTK